jgi:hypothetical protein
VSNVKSVGQPSRRWSQSSSTKDPQVTNLDFVHCESLTFSLGAEIQCRGIARQIRNQRQKGITAEYTKYTEDRLLPGSPSAYSYPAVHLLSDESVPPANNLGYCNAENGRESLSSALLCVPLRLCVQPFLHTNARHAA